MWAENNPDGKGATFAFSLPLSEQQQHQQYPSPASTSEVGRT